MELLRTETFVVRWYDSEKTILLLEILGRWNWDDAYRAINTLNQVVISVNHDVYTIIHFTKRGLMMPQSYALPNLRKFMVDAPNERMIILVNSEGLMKVLLEALHRTFDFSGVFHKFRYMGSLNQALETIARHKAFSPPNNQ